MLKSQSEILVTLFTILVSVSLVAGESQTYDLTSIYNKSFTDADSHAPLGDEGDKCQVDSDCSNYPYFVCDSSKQCKHKDVFPQEPLEWVGIFVFGFIMALCTVAGIGGGGIAISMLIAFFKFETKPAVAISSFSILVCTTMRFFYNFKTRNPEKPHMNVLDYGLASIMMPTTLAGSQIGGYVLLIFPSLYIQVFLTLLLAFLTWMTTKKGMQLHRKEVAAKKAAQLKAEGGDEAEELNVIEDFTKSSE